MEVIDVAHTMFLISLLGCCAAWLRCVWDRAARWDLFFLGGCCAVLNLGSLFLGWSV